MQHKITVNDNFEFEIDNEQANALDLSQLTPKTFHVLHNDKSFSIEMLHEDFLNRKYAIKVNNVTHEIEIGGPLDALIKQMGFETGANKKIDSIKAPMPGLILEVSIKVGDEVQKDDQLLILSAMKMENSFLSPRDGIIKALHVKVGDAVDKGQLLIEFES